MEGGRVLLNISECFASFHLFSQGHFRCFLASAWRPLLQRMPLECESLACCAGGRNAKAHHGTGTRYINTRRAKAKATSTPELLVFPLAGAFELYCMEIQFHFHLGRARIPILWLAWLAKRKGWVLHHRRMKAKERQHIAEEAWQTAKAKSSASKMIEISWDIKTPPKERNCTMHSF